MSTLYVIRHGRPGTVLVYWKPNRCGYTSNVLRAGTYREEEARDIERLRPPLDIAVPLKDALAELVAEANPQVLLNLPRAIASVLLGEVPSGR